MKLELTRAEALNLIAILGKFENDNKDNGGLERLTDLSKDFRGRINKELRPILQNYNQAMKDHKADENCQHSWEIVDSGGDAESGPITITQCRNCRKINTQFGM